MALKTLHPAQFLVRRCRELGARSGGFGLDPATLLGSIAV